MNLASLGSFLNGNIGSIYGNGLLGPAASNSGTSATAARPSSDNSQLSPLAQILSTLQQVQQSDPAEYQQLTQLIATNLRQAAQQSGNAGSTNQLSQLANDFTNAANTGALPNISDLAAAIGGAGDSYGGATSQQSQESSLSLQISFSETSISTAAQDNSSAGGSQAIQEQFQESSLSYQLNFSETTTGASAQNASPNTAGTSAGQASASSQLSPAEAQQLIQLIAQSFQSAARTAQASGNSTEANLLTQLATDFTNALSAASQGNTSSSADASGTSGGQHHRYLQAAAGDSYGGSSSGGANQTVQQQLQGFLLSYQINYSESSTNGSSVNQQALALSGTGVGLSAAF